MKYVSAKLVYDTETATLLAEYPDEDNGNDYQGTVKLYETPNGRFFKVNEGGWNDGIFFKNFGKLHKSIIPRTLDDAVFMLNEWKEFEKADALCNKYAKPA